MSIKCKICNTEFDKIIPWQHLKTHDISTSEYKEKYGPVYSQETLEKHKARIPHNKGKKVSDLNQLEKIRSAIQKREERYSSGELTRAKPGPIPEERAQKISNSVKKYARENRDFLKDRAQRIVQTKINNGYDFGSPMRGKHQTEESKEKSRQNAIRVNKAKKEDAYQKYQEIINQENVILLNSLDEDHLQFRCNVCSTDFQFTKQYLRPSKYTSGLCPRCFRRNSPVSEKEKELFDFIYSLNQTAIQSYRDHYHSKEIDIFIPSMNIGFEFNGLYWHSEEVLNYNNKSRTCDFEKSKEFNGRGIRLIQIFEDEWDLKQHIVKSRIKNILGKTDTVIYARKCQIKKISGSEAAKFCNQNHIMSKGRSNACYGLYSENILVSVMTFTKSNLSRKLTGWELNRFCSLIDTNIVGAASRLFKKFIDEYNPEKIISYSDNRWSNGGLYQTLEFKLESRGTPSYWYSKPNLPGRIHRFSMRKTREDDPNKTEYENRLDQGYRRIWDCGHSRWIWSRDSK